MKRPNGLREWLTFVLTATVVLAGACIAYESIRQRVGVTETGLKEVKADVKLHDTAIAELKTDVKYIREGIDRIEGKLEK